MSEEKTPEELEAETLAVEAAKEVAQAEADALKEAKDNEKAAKEAVKAAKKAEKAASNLTKSKLVRKAHWPKGFKPSGDKIRDTKAILDAQKKVSFLCPLDPGEGVGAEEVVQINGYKLVIKKGHMVEIPEAVAKILANKYRVAMEVTSRSQANATPAKAEALS